MGCGCRSRRRESKGAMAWVLHTSLVLLTLGLASSTALNFTYHYYDEMTQILKNIQKANPDITRLYSIGQSVQERELWVLLLTANPSQEPLLMPNVKYVANMHGNEVVGREMMLHLIEHLIGKFRAGDNEIRKLMDNTRIHIMPSMNPDGFEISRQEQCVGGQGRYNARGMDLNRNFPDYFKPNPKQEQPETRAVRDWMDRIQFVLSGNFHGGALVASYPFDNIVAHTGGHNRPSPTPDDDVFRHLALTYSFNHGRMHQGVRCREGSPGFPNGTTNGAAWYPLTGGMQDYNYVWGGCMEITLEISCCKYPVASRLYEFWTENRPALVKYLFEAHRGVKGIVKDLEDRPLQKANLKIKGRNMNFHTTKRGEFWRILLPGSYTLEVYADGYQPREIQFPVREGEPTVINVTMVRIQQSPQSPGVQLPPWERLFPPSSSDPELRWPTTPAPTSTIWKLPPPVYQNLPVYRPAFAPSHLQHLLL